MEAYFAMKWADKLKKLLKKLVSFFKPKPKPESERLYHRQDIDIRFEYPLDGGGMRKLRRHRSGRLYDQRSGFDPNKRMEDIKDDQTRKPTRKKRGWAEDRGKG